MTRTRFNRRQVLQAAAAGAVALPTFVGSRILGADGTPGTNSRIRVGMIGPGGRAKDLLKESPADLEVVALADCDLRQIDAYRKWAQEQLPGRLPESCSPYQDYRQMFDHEKLDAVFVATTVHARTLICLHAMQAGLDVYAEKPLTLTVEEGQYLIRAEKKYERVSDRHAAAVDPHQQLRQRPGPGLRWRNPHGPLPELRRTGSPPREARRARARRAQLGPVVPSDAPGAVLPELHPGLGRWGVGAITTAAGWAGE